MANQIKRPNIKTKHLVTENSQTKHKHLIAYWFLALEESLKLGEKSSFNSKNIPVFLEQ